MIRRLLTLTLIATVAACNSEGATGPDRPITAVTVTPGTSAMVVGQTAQLAVAVTGGFSSPIITWTSSNTNIVTVSDSGAIVAKAAGTATITAATGGVAGTAAITVTAGTVDRVTVCNGPDLPVCVTTATLPAIGTSTTARATAYNTRGADITASCVFTWTASANGVASIAIFGDATKRDALITRTGLGIISIVVNCSGVPGVFTVNGPVATTP